MLKFIDTSNDIFNFIFGIILFVCSVWLVVAFISYFATASIDQSLVMDMRPGDWFSKNSAANMNTMYRLTPTIIRNLGKVTIGLEYELTSVQYGDKSKGMNLEKGLYDQGLHWVSNNRLQAMFKYAF